ncbi:MAG: sensor histidine kinase [Anaerolineae bacterium]
MRPYSILRGRLALRLFLSYLIVIVVAAGVLASSEQVGVARAFEAHLSMMPAALREALGAEFLTSLRASIGRAFLLAALASILAAVAISFLMSRRVVAPVRQMMLASQRIAAGHYDERVPVPDGGSPESLDELGQLALSFNEMTRHLESTEAMRRQLLADVTHELRTPLSSISGYMEGLIDGVLPAEPETFQKVSAEAERLQRLVQDLQELSRVEAGAYELKRERTDVAALATAVTAHLQVQFQGKGVSLSQDIPPGLPPVFADRDRILQVLTNLLGNALQYTPPGASVVVRAQRVRGEVELTVTDTGIGIDARDLPHVFTRFYRVDRSRSRTSGGTGIGLTIARHLVEAHGGRIWAESPGLGKGSTFHVSLPIAQPQSS